MKFVINAHTDQILGAALLSVDAQELINTVALAMRHRVTASELRDSIYSPIPAQRKPSTTSSARSSTQTQDGNVSGPTRVESAELREARKRVRQLEQENEICTGPRPTSPATSTHMMSR